MPSVVAPRPTGRRGRAGKGRPPPDGGQGEGWCACGTGGRGGLPGATRLCGRLCRPGLRAGGCGSGGGAADDGRANHVRALSGAVDRLRRAALAADARRRAAVMAAERLRELRRLPVADARGDVADGQAALAKKFECLLHPDLGEPRPEAGVAGLRERTLQLPPRRREPARYGVELEVAVVFLLDDLHRFLEEGATA